MAPQGRLYGRPCSCRPMRRPERMLAPSARRQPASSWAAVLTVFPTRALSGRHCPTAPRPISGVACAWRSCRVLCSTRRASWTVSWWRHPFAPQANAKHDMKHKSRTAASQGPMPACRRRCVGLARLVLSTICSERGRVTGAAIRSVASSCSSDRIRWHPALKLSSVGGGATAFRKTRIPGQYGGARGASAAQQSAARGADMHQVHCLVEEIVQRQLERLEPRL